MKWIKKKKNSQDFQSINQNYNIETNMMEVKKMKENYVTCTHFFNHPVCFSSKWKTHFSSFICWSSILPIRLWNINEVCVVQLLITWMTLFSMYEKIRSSRSSHSRQLHHSHDKISLHRQSSSCSRDCMQIHRYISGTTVQHSTAGADSSVRLALSLSCEGVH